VGGAGRVFSDLPPLTSEDSWCDASGDLAVVDVLLGRDENEDSDFTSAIEFAWYRRKVKKVCYVI
jgi:hypothetical protein